MSLAVHERLFDTCRQRKQLAAVESELDGERQQHRATVLTNKEIRATEQQLRDHISQLSSELSALKVRHVTGTDDEC